MDQPMTAADTDAAADGVTSRQADEDTVTRERAEPTTVARGRGARAACTDPQRQRHPGAEPIVRSIEVAAPMPGRRRHRPAGGRRGAGPHRRHLRRGAQARARSGRSPTTWSADGVTLDAARGALIDRAAERDRAVETRPHIRTGGLDEREIRRGAVETALLHRFDPHRYAISEPARDWRGYR